MHECCPLTSFLYQSYLDGHFLLGLLPTHFWVQAFSPHLFCSIFFWEPLRHRMDFPLEENSAFWDASDTIPDDSSLVHDPVPDDQTHRSPPLFRVKRWRRDPPEPATLMSSYPKASIMAPRRHFNRWEDGQANPNYKPLGALHFCLEDWLHPLWSNVQVRAVS